MEIHELKSLLSRFHIRPDKSLGQNFLLAEDVLDQIIAAADLTRADTVLEIGPGLGFLTQRIARLVNKVIAVEKDGKLCQALRKIIKRHKNVEIICGDALKLMAYNLQFTAGYKVVANIPYYLTGRILQEFLSPMTGSEQGERSRPSLIVLLLQKEVAERIIAKPGEMSLLSVSVQFYAEPEIIALVSKKNFYPVPEVDSAIVRLKVLADPSLDDIDEKKFFQLVKIGFANKRKQLQNNLQTLPTYNIPPTTYKQLLASLGLNPLARAQDLSLEDWERLYCTWFPMLEFK